RLDHMIWPLMTDAPAPGAVTATRSTLSRWGTRLAQPPATRPQAGWRRVPFHTDEAEGASSCTSTKLRSSQCCGPAGCTPGPTGSTGNCPTSSTRTRTTPCYRCSASTPPPSRPPTQLSASPPGNAEPHWQTVAVWANQTGAPAQIRCQLHRFMQPDIDL